MAPDWAQLSFTADIKSPLKANILTFLPGVIEWVITLTVRRSNTKTATTVNLRGLHTLVRDGSYGRLWHSIMSLEWVEHVFFH